MDEVSGFSTRVGAKCGRWNPTPEQVKLLTELFASGLRTPTTEQIQMISSHLSSFGKIESKNVFYWFQNHKARERHHKKRRRGGGGAGTGQVCTGKAPDHKKEARSMFYYLYLISFTKSSNYDHKNDLVRNVYPICLSFTMENNNVDLFKTVKIRFL